MAGQVAGANMAATALFQRMILSEMRAGTGCVSCPPMCSLTAALQPMKADLSPRHQAHKAVESISVKNTLQSTHSSLTRTLSWYRQALGQVSADTAAPLST